MARLADIQAARLAGALLTDDAPFTLISRHKVRFWIGASATVAAIILVSWKVESHDSQSSGLSLGEQSPIQEKDMKFTQAMSVAVAAGSICSGVMAQSTAVQWTVASGGNGHWYQVVQRPYGIYSWNSTRDIAIGRGADLLTCTSNDEWQFAQALMQPSPKSQFLAGGRRPANGSIPLTNGWQWIDGTNWTFSVWNAGVPNNNSGDDLYLCVGLGFLPGGLDGWDDWREIDFSAGYVVEWSADCNSDGIVDYGQILSGELIDTNSNGIPDICEVDPCPGDINLNSIVDAVDLAMVLTSWGTSGSEYPRADVNHDGVVNGPDLGALLGGWGFCP